MALDRLPMRWAMLAMLLVGCGGNTPVPPAVAPLHSDTLGVAFWYSPHFTGKMDVSVDGGVVTGLYTPDEYNPADVTATPRYAISGSADAGAADLVFVPVGISGTVWHVRGGTTTAGMDGILTFEENPYNWGAVTARYITGPPGN